MKKVVSFMLAVVAIVCLMSCGGNSKSESNTTSADKMQREEDNINLEDGKAECDNSNTDEGEMVAGVLKKGNWAYCNPTDPMTDEVVNSALCMSNESQTICDRRTHLQLYLSHLPSGSNAVFVQISDLLIYTLNKTFYGQNAKNIHCYRNVHYFRMYFYL